MAGGVTIEQIPTAHKSFGDGVAFDTKGNAKGTIFVGNGLNSLDGSMDVQLTPATVSSPGGIEYTIPAAKDSMALVELEMHLYGDTKLDITPDSVVIDGMDAIQPEGILRKPYRLTTDFVEFQEQPQTWIDDFDIDKMWAFPYKVEGIYPLGYNVGLIAIGVLGVFLKSQLRIALNFRPGNPWQRSIFAVRAHYRVSIITSLGASARAILGPLARWPDPSPWPERAPPRAREGWEKDYEFVSPN